MSGHESAIGAARKIGLTLEYGDRDRLFPYLVTAVSDAIRNDREACREAARQAIFAMSPIDRANADLCDDAITIAIRNLS